MSILRQLVSYLPEVVAPTQKHVSFQEKLKWTGATLVIFFVLGLIPLFGLGQNQFQRFELLSIILGASMGSIISLGIGPLVTGSIVLQLLNGSGIVKFDLTTPEGKKYFQGVQKLLGIGFVIFEAAVFVLMGGLAPDPALAGTALFRQLQLLLVFQLFLGGILIMFMDEVISKWGFGSGISLFIAAGVSQELFIRLLSPFASPTNPSIATGALPALFQSLAAGDAQTAGLMFAAILSTVLVFVISVYAKSMKVEIPLSFGRIRGHGIRWPLSFMYTSNMPVILVAALMANVQFWASLLQNWGYPLLGTFSGNTPTSGLVAYMQAPDILQKVLTSSLSGNDIISALVYLLFMTLGAVVFSWFWVQTSGMDAHSQAENMMRSGLQIPGFRKDARILERILDRYIPPLTIMGALAVGLLASLADLTGSLSRGTGILLTVMIIYQLYEEVAKEHMMDMNPLMRKFME